ncbi:MAG: DUF2974 domain-containing protein [Eggerthellaceae bacterium]|nr:DUF2974 domain-containing protein [Eggerthellaceae bacterium]
MPNIIDYLEHRFETFDEEPFNMVDAAILSQICMVRGKGVIPPLKERQSFADVFTVLRNALSASQKPASFIELLKAEHFADMFTGLDPARIKNCLFAVAASPRFRDMCVRDYLSLFDTRMEMQFAAMTFVQKDDFAVITFRGTDASITGWKEDFNMAYAAPVPAQEQALRYLEAVAPRLPKRLIINGHSKGGNLAEYAALKAPKDIQNRIEVVYNLDGPGFKENMFSTEDYAPVIDRIIKIVPEDSIIGILLHSPVPHYAVASKARGFSQHSVFNWEIALNEASEENGIALAKTLGENERESHAESDEINYSDLLAFSFESVGDISSSSSFTSEVLKRWLENYNDEERGTIVESIFNAIEATGADDVLDLFSGGPRTVTMFRDAAANLKDGDRDFMLQAGRVFAEEASQLATERMGKATAQGMLTGAAKIAQVIENATASRRLIREEN